MRANIFFIILLIFFSTTLQAQNILQEQSSIVFKEVLMPNDKGSVRFLHKTSKEYNVFGDCMDLEDKSKIIEQKKSYNDVSTKFGYSIENIPATYNVTCYDGYGGTEYFIDILSENKELLEEVRKLTLEYLDNHLTKQDDKKYMLGVFETEAKEVKKGFNSTNWVLLIYMFNNSW